MLIDNNMDNLIINNLKSLSIDMINNAKSGHPGIALGAITFIVAKLIQKEKQDKHFLYII